MVWDATWDDALSTYPADFRTISGDRRTWTAFSEIVADILRSGSLVCQRIAATSSLLAAVKDGARRVVHMASGTSTKRSLRDAEHLTAQRRAHAVQQLAAVVGAELWLIADDSDLRKPYAAAMEHLMPARDLAGNLVAG